MSVADSCLSRIWTRCMSLSFGGICLGSKCLLLPSMGIPNTPSGRLWCLVGRFCCVGKTQSGMFLSMSTGGAFNVTSIHCNNCWAQLAFTDVFTTKANCVVVSVYVHYFQSMVVAPKKYVWSTVWSSVQRAHTHTHTQTYIFKNRLEPLTTVIRQYCHTGYTHTVLFLNWYRLHAFGGGDSRHFGPMCLLFLTCRECFAACVIFLFLSFLHAYFWLLKTSVIPAGI